MKLLVLLLCVVSTLAVPLGQSRPVSLKDLNINSSRADLRIIDGKPAVLGQLPWQVALRLFNAAGYTEFCGGSLLSSEWVLTAAQCGEGAYAFFVYAGTVDLEDPNRVLSVAGAAILHPDYNSQTLNNNIALVQLHLLIPLTGNVRSVSLPPRGEVVGAGVAGIISGWGVTSDDEVTVSNELNYAEVTTISNEDCAAVFGPQVVVDSTLCAVGNPSHSPCFGDAGGSFVTYDANGTPILIGVINFVSNLGCGLGLPSGYVRTASHLDWIADQTGLDL